MVSSLDLLHLARTAAERAAGYLKDVERPADPAAWTLKGSRDFVTEVDRRAEKLVSEILLAAEPGSRIVGEELHPELVTDGLVWIVDPLDGTTNFLHDFPSYAVSVAGAVDGTLEAAAIVNVPTGDTYTATRGGGAWHGDRQLAVSAIRDPAFALIGTGFPFKDTSRIGEYLEQFRRVAERTSRHPSSRRGVAGPGRRRGRALRGLLGAVPLGVGHRGRHSPDPGSRRCSDGLRGARGRHRAHGSRGRQPGDPPVAPRDAALR